MKKKFCFLILMTLSFIVPQNVTGMPVDKSRIMYNSIINLLNDYKEYISMLEPDYADYFISLFESESSPVFNDIMTMTAKGNVITANEYADAMRSEMEPGVRYFIRNILHGTPSTDDNVTWNVDITFEKSLLYFDQCSNKFSSRDYFGSDYNLVMSVAWNSEKNECRIKQITGNLVSDVTPLPENFVMFYSSEGDSRNDELYYEGHLLETTEEGVHFLKSDVVDNSGILTYPWDDDVVLNVFRDTVCPRKISVQFKEKHWRVRVHYDISVNDAFGITPVSDATADIIGNSGFEAGIEIGRIIHSDPKTRVGLFTGFDFSSSDISVSLGDKSYSYAATAAADEDGDKYYRYYDVKNLKYNASIVDLMLPVYFDFDFKMSSISSLYIDAGVKAYYTVKQNVNDFSANYSAWGVYPDYNFLKLDYSSLAKIGVEMNGFVNNAELDIDNLENKSLGLQQLSVDGACGIGLRFRLSKNVTALRDLYIDLGATYQYNIYGSFVNNSCVDSKNPIEGKAPVWYTVRDKEKVSTLTGFIESLSRTGSIKAKVSLIYRF